MKCDFCYGDVDDPWIYDTGEFDMHWEAKGKHMIVDAEEGAWSACDTCSALIEDEDLKGLSIRAATVYCSSKRTIEGFLEILQENLWKTYINFMKSRKGKRHK